MIDLRKPAHKHAEVIKAWADGAEIQYRADSSGTWTSLDLPLWHENLEYRVKPREPREFWFNLYSDDTPAAIHATRGAADQAALRTRLECIKVREVIE